MISIIIIIYYLSWSLSEMESKYLVNTPFAVSLCKCRANLQIQIRYTHTYMSVYSTDSIHIYRGKFIVATCDRLRWQTTCFSDADIIATLMDPCDRVLHVPGAPMHPQNIYIYICVYNLYLCLADIDRASICPFGHWSIRSLCSVQIAAAICSDRAGKHSRVEPITYSVQHTINNRFWCQLPWAAPCIIRESEWMITSAVSQ